MKVLLVKLSSLGDVVHSLAAAMDIQHAVPGVSIDWVVEENFAPLLAACPAVHRVISCRLRTWRKRWWTQQTRDEWRTFVAVLQSQGYDAVIDLQGLTKSALISFKARLNPGGRRYAMANPTQGSSYEAPTRWVAGVSIPCPWHSHAVQRTRHVCAVALGYELPAGAPVALQTMADVSVKPKTVALVHGTSRLDKAWPVSDWLTLATRLSEEGFALALPQADAQELTTAQYIAARVQGVTVWPKDDVSALLGRLAACAGVIGVDSGPSHMAVALGLPHVQLYNFDTAWRTGPLGCDWQRSVYDKPCPSIDSVWHTWQACWQSWQIERAQSS